MQSTMNIIIDRTWVLLSMKFVTNWKMITDQRGRCTGKDIQGFEIFSLMKAQEDNTTSHLNKGRDSGVLSNTECLEDRKLEWIISRKVEQERKQLFFIFSALLPLATLLYLCFYCITFKILHIGESCCISLFS